MAPLCPLCRQRKARRACPALDRGICAVCCGTKRLVEIRCPADCVYLQGSRSHPPAVVLRQRERDIRLLVRFVHDLTEPQFRLFTAFQALIQQYQPGAVPALADHDVAEAAAAVAATAETADRGIIYEHQAVSLQAQRLATEVRAMVERLTERAPPSLARDAAVALRRIEQAARQTGPESGGGGTAYLALVERLAALQPADTAAEAEPDAEERAASSKLILP